MTNLLAKLRPALIVAETLRCWGGERIMDHHVDTPQRDALQALLDATANYLGNADRDLLTPLGVTLPVPEMPKTAAWFRAARVTLTVAAKKTDVPAYGIGDVQQAFEKVVQEVRLP